MNYTIDDARRTLNCLGYDANPRHLRASLPLAISQLRDLAGYARSASNSGYAAEELLDSIHDLASSTADWLEQVLSVVRPAKEQPQTKPCPVCGGRGCWR